MKDLRTRIATEMRSAYGEFTGEDLNMIPFDVAKSRKAWLLCADVAIRVMKEAESEKLVS